MTARTPAPRPDYQTGYSGIAPAMVQDREQRELKARKVLAVLDAAGVLRHSPLAVDVGCSGGYFVEALAPHFAAVIGIDIDEPALRVARRERAPAGAAYVMADARLPLRSDSVDLVVCNHVYEHVPDAAALMDEIWRALRPGAACYLGAASRLTPVEPHYRLPFLSWLPKVLADRYMRWAGRGERYYENLRTYWGIRALLRRFEVEDYTLRVVADPDRFHARDLIPRGGWVERVPGVLWRMFYWLLPSYILILRKPARPAAAAPP